MIVMELGDRIEEFSGIRKITYDGECYLLRLPLPIIRIMRKFVGVAKVHVSGVWKNGSDLHIVVTFQGEKKQKEVNDEDNDNDYVSLSDL